MGQQVKAALTMIHNLSTKDDKSLGGSRREVTVKAATVKAAKRIVDQSRFLDPNFGLGKETDPSLLNY